MHDYLQRAKAAGIGWPLPEGWDEDRLESALLGASQARTTDADKADPDFAAIHEQKQRPRHLTLQLLWEEYRQANPEGYGYSRFCDLYQGWRNKLDVVLRQEHKAGEKMFVDWAGATIPLHDRQGGPAQAGHLFVAVLGASSYTCAEATSDEQLSNWIGAQIRALEFYQGVPALIIPDNAKTGVIKACRYDPDLNPTCQEMAMHYGAGVVPARPYKPRDKAKVESGVQIVERWIERDANLFARLVTCEPALIAHRRRVAAFPQHPLERMEHFRSHAKSFAERLGSIRDRHELLGVHRVVGVRSAVQYVHQRQREQVGIHAAEIAV